MIYNEIKFWIVFIILIGIVIYIVDDIVKEIKNNRILREKKMLLDIKIDDSYISIIDTIISDIIVKYRAMNIDHNKNFYMNTKEQEKMIKTVLTEVMSSISPVYYEQICLIYNKDRIEDIICEKVTLAVLAVTVEVNGTYKEV